jgi:hypothetical protein
MGKSLEFEKVDQITDELKQLAQRAFREGQAIDQVEAALYKKLLSLGHALVGSMIEAAGEGDVGETIEKNGRTFKRLPKRNRRYRSIFGDFQFDRYVYGTSPSDAIQAIPLDEHLGLPDNDYSLVLESWTGMLATDSSFHRAIERLEVMLGIHVPLDSSERIEGRLGKSAALVLDHQPNIDRDTEAEILVQTSDNKGIPMVRPPQQVREPVGAPVDRKGPMPDKKQMACMAGIYTVPRSVRTPQQVIDALFRIPMVKKEDRVDDHPRNPRYFAAMTKYDSSGNVIGKTAEEAAQQWMTANTIRRHKTGQPIIVMHDGQKSLWNCAHTYQPDWNTVEILDLLHVLPRIWSAAKIMKPKEEVEQHVKDQLLLLLTGGVGFVIMRMKRFANRKGLAKSLKEELSRIINYLEMNRSRMKYDEYLAAGYPIATGFIEGACRHVIKDRMEQSGMRWKEKGAQVMLNLRCIDASELWDVTIEQHRVVSLSKYGRDRKNYCEKFLAMAS